MADITTNVKIKTFEYHTLEQYTLILSIAYKTAMIIVIDKDTVLLQTHRTHIYKLYR